MTKPKTLSEIMEGKKVQVKGECSNEKSGGIFTVKDGFAGSCGVSIHDHWLVLDPISYTPPKHECEFVCKECNKIKK